MHAHERADEVEGVLVIGPVHAQPGDVIQQQGSRAVIMEGGGNLVDQIGQVHARARPERLAWLDEPAVVSLTTRRLAQLPPDTRPLPSVAVYDQLLRRRPGGRPASEGEP